MHKQISYLTVSLFFLLCLPVLVLAEDITITTYYPSPYGVYNELQLYAHDPAVTTCDDAHKGTMFYNSTDDQVYVCKGATLLWQTLGGGGGWTSETGKVYTTVSTDNVGIGTTAPGKKLEIAGSADSAAIRLNYVPATYPTTYLVDIAYNPYTAGYEGLHIQSAGSTTTNGTIILNPLGGNVGIGTTSPASSLDLGSKTDGIILAQGTTAQRPASPVLGSLRYNTTLSKIEFYNGTKWKTPYNITDSDFSASGGTITDAGGYRTHTFTSSSPFIVVGEGTVDYLIVAGGGSGGGQYAGGGGGGGVIYVQGASIPAGSYFIAVGDGGSSVEGAGVCGVKGGNSTAFGETAIGGGPGRDYSSCCSASGGSGGGGGHGGYCGETGGTATQGGPLFPYGGTGSGYGNRGGNGSSNEYAGGGGAGGVGSNGAVGVYGGDGGPGIQKLNYYWAGGGGGGYHGSDGGTRGGYGGIGGGGGGAGGCSSSCGCTVVAGGGSAINTGGSGGPNHGGNGGANTGGGGGGVCSCGSGDRSGAGGSGIVIIRYLI